MLAKDIEVVNNGSAQTAKTEISARDNIMLYGIDNDGGVRRVWITGTVTVGCSGRSPIDRTYNSDIRAVTANIGDTVKDTLIETLSWVNREWTDYNGCRPDSRDYSLIAEFIGHAENFHGLTSTTPPLSLTYIPCQENLPCGPDHPGRYCRGRPDFETTGRTICDEEGREIFEFIAHRHYCVLPGGRCGKGLGRSCTNDPTSCAPGYLCSSEGVCVQNSYCTVPDNFCWNFDESEDQNLPCR